MFSSNINFLRPIVSWDISSKIQKISLAMLPVEIKFSRKWDILPN